MCNTRDLHDLYEWRDEDSIGYSFTCPICHEESYNEIKFSES